MLNINYQTFGNSGFQLRLRLYKDKETKYINVTKMLVGDIQKKHWNSRKQYFIPSCPFADKNNETLINFRRKIEEQASTWRGSLYGFVTSLKAEGKQNGILYTLDDLLCYVIEDKRKGKHEDGTPKGTYENYVKLQKRIMEFCEYSSIKYDKLAIADVTEGFVADFFKWVKNVKGGKGAMYISKTFHAVLVIADKKGVFDMGTVARCDWKKEKRVSSEKNKTLTDEQCKRLIEMPLNELPRNPKSNIYRDFCVFLMCTGQSPCDAITLKKSNIVMIDGVEHIVFKRRKIAHKQEVPCSLPVTDTMRRIINKWSVLGKNGYIFPIRNKEKMATQKTDNGDIKHFNGRLNNWLKKVGDILGCDFKLHTYTFRHTAITHYLGSGLPVSYVADIMGTSVENCEKIYYNSQSDKNSRNMMLKMSF